ncbi:MAG: segregation/condensation protein A [Fidelibacterota bacterium]|nr:MAG: segregation/condensation protein A [Candidatus Neomarinimicrobiota bacterium]
MAYQVHLENFEGPLDLLLYFIQRDKIDIYDIPIAHITAEYLEYLELMEALNLSVAGEFILLAATLMHIKARMLLPRPEPIGDEPIEDPRQVLVQQLIEYRRFKEASEDLRWLADLRSAHYPVGQSVNGSDNGINPGEYLRDVSLFQLMGVIKEVMDRMPKSEPLQVETEPVQLDDSIRAIHQAFALTSEVPFRQVLLSARRIQEVVVLFLAVLEMMRQGLIIARQPAPFEEIYLVRTLTD